MDGFAYFDAGEVIRILIASLASKGAGWTAKNAFGGYGKTYGKTLWKYGFFAQAMVFFVVGYGVFSSDPAPEWA